jgi:twitching motility protein PilT
MRNEISNSKNDRELIAHEVSEIALDSLTATLDAMDAGIVVYTGSTGSGKSTSQMRFINHLNETRELEIMTVEDPIEFTYKQEKCSIAQYEAGKDIPSIPTGVRILSAAHPDVLQVAEIRDFETAARIILAASSMLILTSLHASGPLAVYDRLVDFIPRNSGLPTSREIDFVEILNETPLVVVHHEKQKIVKVLKFTPKN